MLLIVLVNRVPRHVPGCAARDPDLRADHPSAGGSRSASIRCISVSIVVMTQAFGLLTPPLGHVRDDRLRGRRRADDAHPEAAAHHDDPAPDRHHPVRASCHGPCWFCRGCWCPHGCEGLS